MTFQAAEIFCLISQQHKANIEVVYLGDNFKIEFAVGVLMPTYYNSVHRERESNRIEKKRVSAPV